MASKPDFGADVEQATTEQELSSARDQAARLQRTLAQTAGQLRDARAELDELTKERDRSAAARSAVLDPPKWASPKARQAKRHATPILLLSDLHYQEVVNPAEIGGINAYNSRIAERRIRSVFDDGIKLVRNYSGDLTIDGAVVALNGDMLTGIIHDELLNTNDQLMFPALVSLANILCAGIGQWADEFGAVHVPCEWGNHGRLFQKKKAKGAAGENFDWMLSQMVQAHFANDPRVTVEHTLSPHLVFQVYATRFLLTHGNHGVGGSSGHGIGGIWPTIMRALSKIRAQMSATGVEFDMALMGHWHQFIVSSGLVINGTPKGPDEWSTQMGFTPEPPSQSLIMVTPERGVTDVRAIYCSDRKAESW